MTEQSRELAVVPATPPAAVATVDTDSWVQIAKPIFELAHRVYDTEFVPVGLRGSEPATAAAMLYAREVGLPPLTGLSLVHVVEGKAGMQAKGMRALVLAAGHEIEFTESTGSICEIRGRRRGSENWTTVTWTIDMARAAGLAGKYNWKNWPRRMLQARCTSELCDMVFADVVMGFRAVEELDDEADTSGSDQPASTSKVARKRTPAKKAAAAPAQPRALEAADMPPLPGEPGYEDGPQNAGGGESGDGGSDRPAEPSGEDSEDTLPPATDTPGSEEHSEASDPGAQTGEPGEVASAGPSADDPGSPDAGAEGEPSPPAPAAPRPISRAQQRMIMGQFGELNLSDDREERLAITSAIVGREVESTNDLKSDEAKTLIDTLANVGPDRDKLNRLLDTIDRATAERRQAEDGDDQ